MARKSRQPTRSRKQQTRSRGQASQGARVRITPAQPVETETAAPSSPSPTPVVTTPREGRGTTARPARPYQHRRSRSGGTVRAVTTGGFTLPREAEYGFIRADLRRLLVTAALLAVMMVALLLLLEP